MVSQAFPPIEPLLELQREVQRKLGRCLLRLQQYEILLKTLVAHGDIAGPPDELQSVRDEQVARVQNKTLGTLVGLLTESILTSTEAVDVDSFDEPPGDSDMRLRFRYQRRLDASQYEATTVALKELVDLRNGLVHHFLPRFNIWEYESCIAAEAYLDASYETIDGHFLTLRGWVQGMENARALTATFMSSETVDDLFNGIDPDGTVYWPASGAVCCLREAETQFATEGWTLLNTATTWIREKHPDQYPRRYGCASWRQVIHESRQFEVRKTVNEELGHGEVWYRSCQDDARMQVKNS